ncbi:MAG: hypothetical protein EHM77_00875 [Planctomycetaceae bacterium]|nr:MAG: hypothetical protein EHM77_00875 [Planctomycetaceae bacterium]
MAWRKRPLYEVVTSQLVIDEATIGDFDAARRRLAALDGNPVLPASPDVDSLANGIIKRPLMPPNARLAAPHIATAALAGVRWLLVQTYPDLANATELPMVYKLSNQLGLSGMLACAPIEFFGGR